MLNRFIAWLDKPAIVAGDAMDFAIHAGSMQERRACAAYCLRLADIMEQGAGEHTPGDRLRQAADTILAGRHYPTEIQTRGLK